MQGALVDTPPADLFVRLAGQSATGTLTLSGPDGDGEVQFVHGAVAAARAAGGPRDRGLRLGERLVHAGRLEADDLDRVLADQAAAAAPVALGHLLVERDLVPADVVRLLLQEQALEALTRLLAWRGTYTFEVDPAPAARLRVSLPVDRALLEIRRRERERERVRSLVPGPASIPRTTSTDPSTTPLSPDAVSVLTAVDGRVSVGAIASTLGYGYDEASRIAYRLALQGLVEVEGTNGHAPPPQAARTATQAERPAPSVPDPAAPEVAAPATPAQASPPDDEGFDDEPRPWVGWARGGPDHTGDEEGAADEATTSSPPAAAPEVPAAETEQPAADEPREDRLFTAAPVSSDDVDETTRRELFSELHAVSRAEAEARPSPRPAPPAEPPPPEPPVEEEPEPESEPEPDVPTQRAPVSDLSGDELSSLLRELHDLNQDDGGG